MRFVIAFFCCVALALPAFAADNAGSVGIGVGQNLGDRDCGNCQEYCIYHDGSFENGYCWQYGGIVAPDYGAFAGPCDLLNTDAKTLECICFWFSQVGNFVGQSIDLYVWDDVPGMPGNVIAYVPGLVPTAPAYWPSLSIHCFDVSVDLTGYPLVWLGYWANWPGAVCAFYLGADLDGFGAPYPYMTNIAPGIGYPTGWNPVDDVWGPTQAMGIEGCWSGGSTPVEEATWGQIKALY